MDVRPPHSQSLAVFMCADAGDFSGAHEVGFLVKAMLPSSVQHMHLNGCRSAVLGSIQHANGTNVLTLAITTGIGYISAAVCTDAVLSWSRREDVVLRSIIFLGTAGFSPVVGGFHPTTHHPSSSSSVADGLDVVEDRHTPHVNAMPPYLSPEEMAAFAAEMRAQEVHAARRATEHINAEVFSTKEQLDVDGCSAPTPTSSSSSSSSSSAKKKAKRVSIGSLCATSSAFLMESGSCTEVVSSNQCSRPHCFRFEKLTTAQNIFTVSHQLSQDLQHASEGKLGSVAEMPTLVREGMKTFWAAHEAAGGVDDDADPITLEEEEGDVPSFVTCAESTMNAIFVGAQRDFLCREYSAIVLNRQRQRYRGDVRVDDVPPLTADDVVCVQAMESFGFLESVVAQDMKIPVAILRATSNYDMFPQQKLYMTSAVVAEMIAEALADRAEGRPRRVGGLGDEAVERVLRTYPHLASNYTSVRAEHVEHVDLAAYVWRQNEKYVAEEEYNEFVLASFHYAVHTASIAISNYFFGGRSFS